VVDEFFFHSHRRERLRESRYRDSEDDADDEYRTHGIDHYLCYAAIRCPLAGMAKNTLTDNPAPWNQADYHYHQRNDQQEVKQAAGDLGGPSPTPTKPTERRTLSSAPIFS
jgi:hypothetical protein